MQAAIGWNENRYCYLTRSTTRVNMIINTCYLTRENSVETGYQF